VYDDELQIKFTFRAGPMIFGRFMALICNSSLYTHITKIKSISPSIAKKVVTIKYLTKFPSPRALARPKIIDPEENVNHIKFTFCSGPMIFGRVKALGL
jgi:hypothetical protein